MKLMRIWWIGVFLILLGGCSANNNFSQSFQGLQGNKNWYVQASAGQTLNVEFKSEVTKGSLVLLVISPEHKTLWKAKAETNGTQTKDISLPVNGQYTLQVQADAASGSYQLQYSLKK